MRDGCPVLVGIRESNLFKLTYKVPVDSQNFLVSKETKFDGNSEYGRGLRVPSRDTKPVIWLEEMLVIRFEYRYGRLGHQNIFHVKKFLKRHNIVFDEKEDFFSEGVEACMENIIVHRSIVVTIGKSWEGFKSPARQL